MVVSIDVYHSGLAFSTHQPLFPVLSEVCILPHCVAHTYHDHAGLLATAILKMDGVGGLAGWRWIFILEGIATVVIALSSSIFLPADIQSAKFFTEEEREFARKCRELCLTRRLSDSRQVARLRTAFGVTTTAPLSEPSQRITNRDVDPEKGDEVKTEVQTMEQVVVNAEDEKFEWGEVLRGTNTPLPHLTATQ